jgi:hypothetical protein
MALLWHSLIYGLILSVGLIALTALSFAWKPALWVDKYPPDVRARFGPMDERLKRQKWLVALPIFGVMAAVLVAAVRALPAAGLTPTFLTVTACAFLVALVFNVVDLVVLDWLYFIVWQPRWLILPGTEGLAGYRDLGYHVRGFFKGLVFCGVAALLAGTLNGLLTGAW